MREDVEIARGVGGGIVFEFAVGGGLVRGVCEGLRGVE